MDLFVKTKGTSKIADEIGIGEPTLIDILENLKRPGRDPREEMPNQFYEAIYQRWKIYRKE